MSPSNDDLSPTLDAHLDGWNAAMGLRFVRATADEVIAECTVGPQHLQPYGLVHGGVYSGVIETVASVGAAVYGMTHGLSVVGLDNHTSCLRAVREGRLRVTAKPLVRGGCASCAWRPGPNSRARSAVGMDITTSLRSAVCRHNLTGALPHSSGT